MHVPSLGDPRRRPGRVGGALAVAVLFVDDLVGVSVFDVGVVLLVGGALATIWGANDVRMAGVAAVVAGVGTVVGGWVLAQLHWGILPVVALVAVLWLVGVTSR